ncbi:hypothetical protein EYZ11_000450 [Aspergillus tanneri]|uniref:Malonyl-CoA:ACP transacylase (MAT) domain-containing protein n=1 Tax=Aspergillus tanneri TaxID=1220188 RepID=A0A4S3JX83_9EURO|nr:hypothetical protein EYZ11_000450 [Aspergillus tanneri]
MQELCDWPIALAGANHKHDNVLSVSHVVVFDRGSLAPLVKKVTEGHGIRIVQGGEFESRDPDIGSMQDLVSPILLESSTKIQSWGQLYQPRLTTASAVGLETRLSRLLGTPPVMVGGMTPTTVHWDFVSAIMNAGYHTELAGGGYHKSADMEAAINRLADAITPGRGITCNLIYANPRAMGWQIALLRRLSQRQILIEGLTIGAGVPSLDVVTEYIRTLGLRHIGFKPGSVGAIRQVVDIAKSHPEFPIILQWTGGRGGGHHSFEDFHAPILKTYGLIRQHVNIYLVAGSGFGTGESIHPYLTGMWSVQMGYAAMPFDGVLLGSRMMVAREAHTSPPVKEIICKTPGVPDNEWENTYLGPSGGIITVQSEMGEPIHKVANRGSIITRLNEDFAKPWFGRNSHGDAVDLKDMTYGETMSRLVALMYVHHQRRWVDPSYIDFTMSFATRALERFCGSPMDRENLSRTSLKENPDGFIRTFVSVCPDGADTVLNPEDVSSFLIETKRPNRKPVNFIPVLNEDFEFYFKKDSLWQSEDIEAVVDRDAERVCILHGPVAAQYSRDQDQSAKDILDSITMSLVDIIQRDGTSEDLNSGLDSGLVTPDSWSTISTTARALPLEELSLPSSVTASEPASRCSPSPIGLDSCRTTPAWIQAVLGEKTILYGSRRQDNPFRCFLETYPESILSLSPDHSRLSIITKEKHKSKSSMTLISHNGVDIEVEVYPDENTESLRLLYQFNAKGAVSRMTEISDGRIERSRDFYSNVWFGKVQTPDVAIHDTFYGRQTTLTAEMLNSLIMAVGPAFQGHRGICPGDTIIPISIGIVIAWEVISRPLVAKGMDGDLLRLVHRSNTFEYHSGATPLRVGDIVSSQSQVQAVYFEEAGKAVVVEAVITRCKAPVLTVTSEFLFRGSAMDVASTFRRTKEPDWIVRVSSTVDEEVLRHRRWLHLHDNAPSLVGKSLVFSLRSDVTHTTAKSKRLRVTGTVRCRLSGHKLVEIGEVHFECDECSGNPVVDFMQRKGVRSAKQIDFDRPGWSGPSELGVQMPASNHAYAELSKDFNPIHTSSVFANLAQLPGTICHGMCTSAITVSALEYLVLEGERERLKFFKASFVAMVMPLEKLVVRIQHTGMVEGRMRFIVEVFRSHNDEKVLHAEAEVEQPRTAYLFTGQGSQSQGMGMDLYQVSPVAKGLWDEIDAQLYGAYGWSVLDIVRNNPRTITINFGGKKGRRIRQNYLSITTESTLSDGSRIVNDSRGLLYSTQFAQPAILVFEAAVFAEMRAKGYVSQDAVYAGHSLGEYGALSALSRYVSTGALAELAFYRGLMMQASVQDGQGGAGYGMVAANPKRVGPLGVIATASGGLLEIVNFNVEGEQYVCSGTTTNLYVLGKLLDHIAQSARGLEVVHEAVEFKDGSEAQQVLERLLDEAKELPHPIELQRGKATIPLQGIDVPFHSTHLRSTVDRFRQCLLKPGFLEGNVDVEGLVGRYIPNLMARAFSLDEEYIREVYELTGSVILREMLDYS